MAALIGSYNLYFSQPWWLLACLLLIPIIWFARHTLSILSPPRRTMVIILRSLVVIILVALLARPKLAKLNRNLSLITVLDRSQSIPPDLDKQTMGYLTQAFDYRQNSSDQLAVIDIAEMANITKLPSSKIEIRERNTSLTGQQSILADGIQMALAIAPPDTATRILLVSDGNETSGNLKEAARIAAANKIPIDVLPLRYQYDREVIFRRLDAPTTARSNQTIPLRFVLSSTIKTSGKLHLSLNGDPVDLDPQSAAIAVAVDLKPGTNVKTISLPVGTRGMHEYEAVFVPDDPQQDRVPQNNRAGTITLVRGPGHVLIVGNNESTATFIANALKKTSIDVKHSVTAEFPDNITSLMDSDAVILINTPCNEFTYQQQELLCRYVNDLGGGLIMVGGNHSFGAGGWIGSALAEILPVDMDPPQKKQLPKGALVLIMHACEIPMGNLWGKRIAAAAVNSLSRLDLVGILAFNWQGGTANWVYPFSEVGDKEKVIAAINQMQMGDMPDFAPHMQAAYQKLSTCNAAQKHVIIISDGDPQPPTTQLLTQYRQACITCTGIAINPHQPQDVQSLRRIAQATGGRFYNVNNPNLLPQIFIKEAQVVRRALIVEETFTPQITYSLSEIAKGFSAPLPPLDGYILTGPKSGLNQLVLTSDKGDPILATCQSGLGRCAVFTSAFDSRWAANWISWNQTERFWEQMVRWAGKSALNKSRDCEVFTDIQGRRISLNFEGISDNNDNPPQFAHIEAQIFSPDASIRSLPLTQIGPSQFHGHFQAGASGNYLINLRYRKVGQTGPPSLMQFPVTVPFAPEFRDLSHNEALLNEICQITNGRLIQSPPQEANLFDHTGIKFPEIQKPITDKLMYIWLALFLLDIAWRRIALDLKAIKQKTIEYVRRPWAKQKSDQTIDRLQQTRDKVRRQYSARVAKTFTQQSARKYQAKDKYVADLPSAKPEPPPRTETGPTEKKTTLKPPTEESSHIQQLLQAKRKAKPESSEDEKNNR